MVVVVVVVVVVVLGRVYFLPVLPWPVKQEAPGCAHELLSAAMRPRTVHMPRDFHKRGPALLSQPRALGLWDSGSEALLVASGFARFAATSRRLSACTARVRSCLASWRRMRHETAHRARARAPLRVASNSLSLLWASCELKSLRSKTRNTLSLKQ